MGAPVIVDVAGANIGRDDTPRWAEHTREAFRRLRHAKVSVHRDDTGNPKVNPRVALVQEMNDDDVAPEWAYARREFPPRTHSWWPEQKGPGSLVPVALPKGWVDVPGLSRTWRLSDGRRKVSPVRYMTVRVAEVPGLRKAVGFASFQLVAGAWTHPGQPAEAWRRQEWGQGADAVEDALRQYRASGVTVVGECDTNRPGGWHFGVNGFRRIETHGLDMLWVVQGKGRHAVQVDVRRSTVMPLPIDGHDLLVATLALT